MVTKCNVLRDNQQTEVLLGLAACGQNWFQVHQFQGIQTLSEKKSTPTEKAGKMSAEDLASCPRYFADTINYRSDGRTIILSFGISMAAFGGNGTESLPEVVVIAPMELAVKLHAALGAQIESKKALAQTEETR